jgi:Uma2 family endonuclease
MATVQGPPLTIADLLEQLGNIDPARVRLRPLPGKATEKDLLRIHDREDKLYELVDGVLVEKVMGFTEGALAFRLGALMAPFVDGHDLGILAGSDTTMRLMKGLVRLPDLSYVSWKRLGKREYPSEPIPDLAPELAIEVLSIGNTPKEMERKLREYFLAGVILVWFINSDTRTVEVFTAPDQSRLLDEGQILDGGEVLPGLALPVKDIFLYVPRESMTGKGKGRRRSRKKREER